MGVPEGWNREKVSDLGQWFSGGTPSKNRPEYWEGTLPWISPKDMKVARLRDAIDHVSEDAVGNGTRKVDAGALLVVVRGMILAHSFPVGLTEVPATFNQDMKALVPADGRDPEYLLYWLQSQKHPVLALVDAASHGTKRLPTERFFDLDVPLPPLPEQRKIAAILSSVDEAIEATQAVIDQVQVVKKGLMQELLTKGLPGRHKKFKQTEIGQIPEQWEVVELGALAEVERGKFSHRPRNDPAFYGGDIPFVQTGDVTACDGWLVRHSQTLNERGLSVSRLFPKGTVLITIAANIGETGIATYDVAFPDSLVGITVGSRLENRFLQLVLRLRKQELVSAATESAQKNINLQTLKPFRVQVPTIEEQVAISDAIDLGMGRERSEQSKLEQLLRVKAALMSVLLTGELRVQPETPTP